jgi:exodeoxyribonuclease VII large subunit
VADLRAPTPSAAAELVVPDVIDFRRRIDELAGCLDKCLRHFLEHQKTRLRFLSERTLAREVLKRLRDAQQRIDLSRETLQRHIRSKIDGLQSNLSHTARALQLRSPTHELTMRHSRFLDQRRRFAELPLRLLKNAEQRFRRVEAILRVLGPDATVARGYSITTDERGKLIRTVASVRPRLKIRTRVSDGAFGSEVTDRK